MLIILTMKENIQWDINKEKEGFTGVMVKFMMGNGTKERNMEVECGSSPLHLKNHILANGLMENLMDLECFLIILEIVMRGSLKMD